MKKKIAKASGIRYQTSLDFGVWGRIPQISAL